MHRTHHHRYDGRERVRRGVWHGSSAQPDTRETPGDPAPRRGRLRHRRHWGYGGRRLCRGQDRAIAVPRPQFRYRGVHACAGTHSGLPLRDRRAAPHRSPARARLADENPRDGANKSATRRRPRLSRSRGPSRAAWNRPMIIDATRLLLFPALMAFAASSDLLTMTISNKVSLALAAGFLVLAPAAGMGIGEIGMHAAAGFTALAVAFCLFACGWIGGGDAKLAAATALWLGFDQLLPYLFVASLLGGALTLLIMRFRLMPLPIALQGASWAERLHRKDAGVPYGIALAAAALIVYPDTIWMHALAS